MANDPQAPRRAIIYCIVPDDLAERLHEPLRRHFAQDPNIEVLVEQRWRDRRRHPDRRLASDPQPETDRRRIRAAAGRRVADRRAAALMLDTPADLPRKARPHVDRLSFIERLQPSTIQLEDRDAARLVSRFQAGDESAFAELYVRYFDRVYNYLRLALRDATEAEDLAQHVFARVYEALGSYERRDTPFRGWLFRIVRNATVSQFRKLGRVNPMDPEEMGRLRDEVASEDDITDGALGWVSDRDLLLFIERLPPAQRQVLVLRFMLDLNSAEIADVLDLTATNVRVLQARALAFLEQRLRNIGRAPRTNARRPRARRFERQALVLRGRRFALFRQ